MHQLIDTAFLKVELVELGHESAIQFNCIYFFENIECRCQVNITFTTHSSQLYSSEDSLKEI